MVAIRYLQVLELILTSLVDLCIHEKKLLLDSHNYQIPFSRDGGNVSRKHFKNFIGKELRYLFS